MKKIALDPPTLGFVVATRAALAFGIGLLVSKRIPDARRRRVGRALVTFGALSTIPAIMAIVRQSRAAEPAPRPA
jgi:hypothetical protein